MIDAVAQMRRYRPALPKIKSDWEAPAGAANHNRAVVLNAW